MDEPIWILKQAVLAAHRRQLATHGGSDGIRDESLFDSALAKPKNVFAYEEGVDIFRLAASYAFGIARNHAFVDGNKRTALTISLGFLIRNGWNIEAPKADLYQTFLSLAEGSLSENDLTIWLRAHSVASESFSPPVPSKRRGILIPAGTCAKNALIQPSAAIGLATEVDTSFSPRLPPK